MIDLEMKDSGIEWIGIIPKDWNVKRLKYLTEPRKQPSDSGNETLLSVTESRGIVKRQDLRNQDDPISRSESLVGYLRVQPGDLVNNIMLVWKRGLGVSSYEGIVSPSYSVFFLLMNVFHLTTIIYFVQTNIFVSSDVNRLE